MKRRISDNLFKYLIFVSIAFFALFLCGCGEAEFRGASGENYSFSSASYKIEKQLSESEMEGYFIEYGAENEEDFKIKLQLYADAFADQSGIKNLRLSFIENGIRARFKGQSYVGEFEISESFGTKLLNLNSSSFPFEMPKKFEIRKNSLFYSVQSDDITFWFEFKPSK